jgi:histidinol-phosphatase
VSISLKKKLSGEMMGYREEYGTLLEMIADEADRIALQYFRGNGMRVERKGDGSKVTEADQAVEKMARAKVAASGLALDVLGEEMGGVDGKAPSTSGRPRLIIDPIDGTEEFSRGIPTFGTLTGIERDGEIVAGMASAPGFGSRWWAYRGQGAYRDGKKIHVSDVENLSDAMVFTGGTGSGRNPDRIEQARRLLDAARHGRSLGGFWQHMLVAEGATEVALDLRSQPWDLAPLGIIVEEAGGRSTSMTGEKTIYGGNFVSTNGRLHDEVLKLLQ